MDQERDVQIVELIAREVRPGLVVDLGAGLASTDAGSAVFRAVLAEAGYTASTIGEPADLADPARLAELLDRAGEIRVIALRGLLGQIPEPGRLLRFLSKYAATHDDLLLVIAVPNVGHRDVALGLLAGHWLMPVGDGPASGTSASPQCLFTRETLLALLATGGWQCVATHDLVREHTDQHDPGLLLHAPTLAGDALREIGRLFNPDSRVSEFVWVLRPKPAPATPHPSPVRAPTEEEPEPRPAVSILMRTQGRRNELLTEALYSIAAQTSDAYEVVLGFHNPDDRSGDLRTGVERLLTRLPAPLQEKLRLVNCQGEGRGAPLNTLLEAAHGLYASFLDDDDLLLDHHVETLVQGIAEHGADVLFQTFAAQRLIEPVAACSDTDTGTTLSYPYTAVAMSIPWDRPFDPVAQHHHNLVPICCMAVPTPLVQQTSLRFRVDLDVGEDWDFWMGASQLLRVVVLPEVTAVVNHWNDAVSNAMRRPDLAPRWHQVRDTRHHDHAAIPLLLDGRVRPDLQRIGRQPEELDWLRSQLKQREARLASIQRSRAWRLAELVWKAREGMRRVIRAGRPS